jgi:hypothetical protein
VCTSDEVHARCASTCARALHIACISLAPPNPAAAQAHAPQLHIADDKRVGIDARAPRARIHTHRLVSSDLAHTHLADGPYGFCSCALAFDRAISAWVEPQGSNSEVRRERRRAALLQEAALQQMLGAKACGFTGLVLLQGAFDASFPTSSEAKRGRRLTGGGMRAKGEGGGADVKGAEWEGQLLANYHPTYYGMAVARFEKTRVGMHRDADGSGGGMSLDDTGDNRVA